MKRWVSVLLVMGLTLGPVPARAGDDEEKLDGYAEWRRGDVLVVDGQRVQVDRSTKLKLHDEASGFRDIPLGYEVKVKGRRQADGVILARELEAKFNGQALFERDLVQAFDEIEQKWVRRGRAYEEDENGNREDYGRLRTRGPEVDRVRRIASELVPPYLDANEFRVYVIDNEEWNAFAAPNRSIYVFSGLLEDMDDDEVAVILGHELVHATHEHSRKEFKKAMIIQLAALGVVVAAEGVDSKAARVTLQVAAVLGALAWKNGYGRSHEDQADRVGLRYAYEAGFDIHKGPRLWQRFARKYGDSGGKLVNFFLGNHSQSKDRQKNLERELAVNYRDGSEKE